MDCVPGILIEARLNDLDRRTRVGKIAAQQTLTDEGDRIIWSEAGRRVEWTLPDQPARADVPCLRAVVLATSATQVPGGTSSDVTLLLLVGDGGRTLARVARASLDLTDLYDPTNLDRIWPASVFTAVQAHGVDYRVETYEHLSDLDAAHAGSVPTSLRFVGQSANTFAWWLAGAAILIIGLVWVLGRS